LGRRGVANDAQAAAYRRLGATIIDGTRSLGEVADAILALGASRSPSS
jgi:hypothetical protein